MEKKSSHIFAGLFVLAMVLIISSVFAISYDLISSGETAEAGEEKSMLVFNLSNVSTEAGLLNNVTINITGTAYSSLGNITNISLSDGTNTYYNDSFITSPVIIDLSDASITEELNFTINYTLNSTSTFYGLTFGVNVTAIGNQTADNNISYSVLPYASSLASVTETTNPTATAICSDIYRAQNFACTCSGTDSGILASGVSTSTGSSTAGSITDTGVPGTYTYTCTVTDVAGNSASATKSYLVRSYGTSSGGSSGSVVDPTQKKITLTKVTPGTVTIIKNFDAELGVKQISIEVKNEAQNIKVTVTKHDGKPAAVSKERSGKVYQYFEVDAPGLENNIDKVIMRIKVKKTWVSSEKLTKEDVLVYKFDETSEEWKELVTKYVEDDGTYYYYDVELDSFSYFAIGTKTLTEEVAETAKDTVKDIASKRNINWYVILIVLAGLAIWFYFFRKRE